MAFIIDGKTPTYCYNCPCYDGMDGSSRCQEANKDVTNGDARPEWCPICGEAYISSRDKDGNPTDVSISIILDQMLNSIKRTPDKWERTGIGAEIPSDISNKKLKDITAIVKQVESKHPEVAIGDREGIRKIRDVLERNYDEEI